MSSDPYSKLPTEELLRLARAGDRRAWEELLARYQKFLGDCAEQKVPKGAPGGIKPSDVAQEAALKALNSVDLSKLKSTSQGGLESLLRDIVESSFLDLLRKANAQKRDDSETLPLDSPEAKAVPASQPTSSQVSAQRETWRDLLSHLYELPDEYREALTLFYFQGLSANELKGRLKRPTDDAVTSLLRRAAKALRARMEGSVEQDAEAGADARRAHNQIDAALSAYFRLRMPEVPFDIESFVADYPDCAEELRGLLRWLEELRNLRPS